MAASGDLSQVGPYRLHGRLGAGSQGVVHLGTAPSGERVAVKVLRAELTGSPRMRDLFLREIQLAQRVAQFCTARVLDAGLHEDRPYVVSEYIHGRSLQQAVAEDGPISGGALERLAVGTATALTAIHEAGIVHRDFKPANVLLGPDGPRVIDFGIARSIETATTVVGGGIAGTPGYMAPEQLRGEEAGPAADVFAWGCVLGFAATGRPPYGTGSLAAFMNRVLHGEPELTGLDGTIAALVVASLHLQPEQRPSAESLLLRLLGRSSASTTVPALTEGSLVAASGVVAPRRHRRRIQLIGGAVLATVLVIAGTFAITNAMEGEDPRASPTTTPPGPAAGRSPAPGRLPGGLELLPDTGRGLIALTSYIVGTQAGVRTYVLDPKTGTFTLTPYTEAVLSPDGLKFAAFEDRKPSNRLAVVDRQTGQVRQAVLPERVTGLQWSPDGRRIVTTAWYYGVTEAIVKGLVVIDVETMKTTFHKVSIGSDPVDASAGAEATWDRNGAEIVAVSGDKLVHFNLEVAELRQGPAMPTAEHSAHYSSNGGVLATPCAGADQAPNDTCFWNMFDRESFVSGKLLRVGRLTNLRFVAWYDTNQIVAERYLGQGKGFELVVVGQNGQNLRVLMRTGSSGVIVSGVHFTPIPR